MFFPLVSNFCAVKRNKNDPLGVGGSLFLSLSLSVSLRSPLFTLVSKLFCETSRPVEAKAAAAAVVLIVCRLSSVSFPLSPLHNVLPLCIRYYSSLRDAVFCFRECAHFSNANDTMRDAGTFQWQGRCCIVVRRPAARRRDRRGPLALFVSHEAQCAGRAVPPTGDCDCTNIMSNECSFGKTS